MRESTYRDLVCAIGAVATHIQLNLDEPLGIEGLAKVAGFSPFHFQRCFHRLVGEAVMVHVRRIRLERSAYRLRKTDDSISNIAAEAGFGSLAAFSRAFEMAFSVPPSRYRSSPWLFYWQTSPIGVHYSPDAPMTFKPLVRRGTPTTARVEYVPEFSVLAMYNDTPVQYAKVWGDFFDVLTQNGISLVDKPLISFTHQPRKPSQAWKIRGYVSIATDEEIPGSERVGTHQIEEGNYLIKRYQGSPIHIADFWARVWQEDLWQLRVRQRYATAYNHFVSGFNVASEDFVLDIYLPVQDPRAN